MTEKATLAALKQRVPFRVARRILVAAGYPTGVSWGDIKQKLGDQSQTANTDPAKLLNLYRESLVATEKSVRAYNSPTARNKLLVSKLNKQLSDDASHPLSVAFPYPVSQTKLSLTTAPAPVLVGKVALPDGDAFVLSYIRAIRYREQIPVTSVKGIKNSDYQEVYGIKVDLRQAFEVIVIPTNKDKVYVLVDAMPGINDQVILSGHSSTENFIRNIAGKSYLKDPFNLFEIIKPLYLMNEGNVLSVSHNAATSSTRNERMRGSKKCLKQEAFHEAGMMALSGNTDLYGVRKAWDMPVPPNKSVNVELSIEGSYSLSYQTSPELYEGHISKCASYREAQFVLNKLAALIDDI